MKSVPLQPHSPGSATGSRVLWPLRLMLLASILAPALLFLYAAWANYRDIIRQSEERIERALDVVQEHALSALRTVERAAAETNEVLRDLPDADIRVQEERLSHRLRRTQDALPHIEAIWAFDREGRPLVSSTIHPVPRNLDNSDRNYFQAHLAQDGGTYIGELITARIGGFRFFVVSRRRPEVDGAFNGVIAISVLPSHFQDFYARISRGIADSFGLVRADGAFLARHPLRDTDPTRLNPQSVFMRILPGQPERGLFTATSQIDGIERRFGYRSIPGYPLYVQVGIETAAVWRELRSTMLGHLVFGVPATLLLWGLSLYALRRTRGFHAEVGRREAAEAALKQAQRLEAVGQVTGGVAHDFNNLLMVVNGNAERMDREPLSERQKRSLHAIRTAAQRGAALTRQLLSFSRQQTHEPTVTDLGLRLPEMRDMLRSSLRGDIAVEVQAPEDLWPVKIDIGEFELAILNIAVNARDAMPAGGRLTIAARNIASDEATGLGLQGEFVAVDLTDTGSGIPPEVLARVFEPFFTTKDIGKGTGLGLSQVYGFAKQSGGTATAVSEPGRGTTISLYLPRSPAMPQTAPAGRAEAAPSHRISEGHILLVEDNADVAEIARAHLEEFGYTVTHAADGRAALAVLNRDERIDLVFSDIVMPGDINGVDLARLIRERHPTLPVLLATGYSTVAQEAADEGLFILRKPYDSDALAEAIRRMMRSPKLRAAV